MTAFDEPVARKPFADLGRDIGNVNKYYSRGEHPSERRAAEQFAAEQETIATNVRPAMKTNNRLRNYMHFMAPLIQDHDNLDDDAADEVGERYRDLREAGLANTIGGARANAMDRGVHDPLIGREDVGLYRSLPRNVPAQADPSEMAVPSEGVGRKSLNLWQEGDPEPEMKRQAEPDVDGVQAPAMPVQAEPQQARPVIDPRLAGTMLFGAPSVAASMMRGEPQAQQRDYSHLDARPRRRAGGMLNPMNWGWVKRLRNWWSGTSRTGPRPGAAEPEGMDDSGVMGQMAELDQAEAFRPEAPVASRAPVQRRAMFGRMARRQSV